MSEQTEQSDFVNLTVGKATKNLPPGIGIYDSENNLIGRVGDVAENGAVFRQPLEGGSLGGWRGEGKQLRVKKDEYLPEPKERPAGSTEKTLHPQSTQQILTKDVWEAL